MRVALSEVLTVELSGSFAGSLLAIWEALGRTPNTAAAVGEGELGQ